MTRDEAIDIIRAKFASVRTERDIVDFVDALIALGLLKAEEPRTPTLEAVNIAVRFTRGPRDLNEMFHEFELAGLKIVRADGRE